MSRKFTLSITCDNAAFDQSVVPELKRLLKLTRWMMGQYLADGTVSKHAPLMDANGNVVGAWKYEVDE